MANKPSAKTGYTALAGAASVILFAVITAFTGFTPDATLAAAVTTVLTAAIAYFVPAKSGKHVDWAEDPDAFEVIEGEDEYGDERWETAGEIRHGDIVTGGGARG